MAFPTVLVEVEADGQHFDELHVNGGGASQIFLYPLGIDWRRLAERFKVHGTPKTYLIRNARFQADYETVEPTVTSIARRSTDSLLRTQGFGDMYRVYLATKRDGLSYHLAHIPNDFTEQPKETFDTEHKRKLFDLAHKLAKGGYPCSEYPPEAAVQ